MSDKYTCTVTATVEYTVSFEFDPRGILSLSDVAEDEASVQLSQHLDDAEIEVNEPRPSSDPEPQIDHDGAESPE